MNVRYTYRLRPGQQAKAYLSREWGMCRYVWNELVAKSRDEHLYNQIGLANGVTKDDLPTFGYHAQARFLTGLRASTTDAETGEQWLRTGSSVCQQQTVRDFDKSRTRALMDRKNRVPATKRAGLPKFKSKHTSLATMEYTLSGFSLKPDPDTGVLRLVLPGKVWIPVVWSRDLPTAPKSVRVYQDSIGHWYASFVTTTEIDVLPPTGRNRALGVDWGVAETATTVSESLTTGVIDVGTGYDLPHAEHGKKSAARLGRYQRMMARRATPKGQPKTRGYDKARRLAAKAHKKVARQREDDARKWAKRLVADHDYIAVEDFRPKFLAKSTMARKSADAVIGATKSNLIWMATKHGRDVRLVHPKHTTTDCSKCDARTKHRLPLGERTYTCETCGHTQPRDKNSATVILHRAGFVPADVDSGRPRPATARNLAA